MSETTAVTEPTTREKLNKAAKVALKPWHSLGRVVYGRRNLKRAGMILVTYFTILHAAKRTIGGFSTGVMQTTAQFTVFGQEFQLPGLFTLDWLGMEPLWAPASLVGFIYIVALVLMAVGFFQIPNEGLERANLDKVNETHFFIFWVGFWMFQLNNLILWQFTV